MKISLRILVFVALSGMLVQAAVAQKCKFEFEDNDPFTGKLSRGTLTTVFPTSISTNESWNIGILRSNNEYTILNDINLAGRSIALLNKGDSLMLATKDGHVITCYAQDRVGPEVNIMKVLGKKIVTTSYISKYLISKEDLEVLSGSELSKIRINIDDEVFEQELKSKHGRDFMNDAGCIMH